MYGYAESDTIVQNIVNSPEPFASQVKQLIDRNETWDLSTSKQKDFA